MTLPSNLLDIIQVAVDAAVQKSIAATIQPVFRQGVVTDHDATSNIHQVQMDGDIDSIPCHDITTSPWRVPIGAKVTILFAPPHGAFIIGIVNPTPGLIRQIVVTTNSPPYSSGSTVTDLVLPDVPLLGGVTYSIHYHDLAEFSSVNAEARWILEARVDGDEIDRMADLKPRSTGVSYWVIDSTTYYTPSISGDYDIDILITEIVDGAGIELQGNSTDAFRHLTVRCEGVLPGG